MLKRIGVVVTELGTEWKACISRPRVLSKTHSQAGVLHLGGLTHEGESGKKRQ